MESPEATRREQVAQNIRRWPLWQGVLVTGVILLVLTVVGSVALITTAENLGSTHRYQNDHLDAGEDDVSVLLSEFLNEESGVRGYLLAGQAAFLQPYDEATRQVPRTETALRRELAPVPGALADLDTLLASYDRWYDGYLQVRVGQVASGQLALAQHTAEGGQGAALFDQIRRGLDQLRDRLRAAQVQSEARQATLQHRLEQLLIASLAVLGVAILATMAVTLWRVVRPLRAMTAAARRVAGGELHADVPVSGPAELRALAGDLGAMRRRLLEEIATARMAGEALRADSPTVSALHQALTPRRDDHPDLRTGGRLDPAEGVLAGDWYDLLRVGDRLATVVGDVSGHGPRSAVLALGLRKVISTVLVSGGDPGEALAAAAASVADEAPEHFATVWVAVISPATGRLEYASAGHPAAILVHPGAGVGQPGAGGQPGVGGQAGLPGATEELEPTGPFVSPIVARWSWSTRVCAFEPGARLLVYTDGVTEGRNAVKEEYGIDRLKGDLAGRLPDDPAGAVDEIADNVNRFVAARQTDDRTLVYFEHRLPAPAPALGGGGGARPLRAP